MMPRSVLCLLLMLSCSQSVAAAEEQKAVKQFLAKAGMVVPPSPDAILESATQSHGSLSVDQSCYTHTPLCIGNRKYPHGLGTHANSRIVFQLERIFNTFSAEVGIDNNEDTKAGKAKASVQFLVKGDGRELAKTPVCRFGESPRTYGGERRRCKKTWNSSSPMPAMELHTIKPTGAMYS